MTRVAGELGIEVGVEQARTMGKHVGSRMGLDLLLETVEAVKNQYPTPPPAVCFLI